MILTHLQPFHPRRQMHCLGMLMVQQPQDLDRAPQSVVHVHMPVPSISRLTQMSQTVALAFGIGHMVMGLRKQLRGQPLLQGIIMHLMKAHLHQMSHIMKLSHPLLIQQKYRQ